MFEFLKKKKEPLLTPIKRELPLIEAHTFKTGEKLYTYRAEDWGDISSRYYRNIQAAHNSIENYGQIKPKWNAFMKNGKQTCLDGVKLKKSEDKDKLLMDIYASFVWWEQNGDNLKNATETMNEFYFCMYYLLEDEHEKGYSEIHNQKKIELLNNEDAGVRDFFLRSVENVIKSTSPLSRVDTLSLLNELKKIEGQWELLNMPRTTTS